MRLPIACRPLAPFVASLVALVFLTSCSGTGTPTSPVQGKTDISTLANRDCFNADPGSEISVVTVVGCSTHHDNEIFARYKLAENFFGSTPYDDDIARAAAEA